ncbi:chymotrypsin-2 isoform X4 [Penaeus vannamei]|uniref:chymotrypsin-2 isoform X4 n=1 Tax=Penaeus vannamei TaxID=6689 RepID=UPI00387F99D3
MFATLMFLFAALCVSAVTEVPLWELEPFSPIELRDEGPPPPESSEGPPLRQRIMGGREATPFTRKYQAFLRAKRHFCGAAIISDQFVLTAAHCVARTDYTMVVIMGIHDLRRKQKFSQEIIVVGSFIHPEYGNGFTISNDIAVVKLQKRIRYHRNISPIKLPTRDIDLNTPIVVTGWGKTSATDRNQPTTLREIVFRTISYHECKNHYKWMGNDMFCARAKETSALCKGDTGGPAMHDGYLVGIVPVITNDCNSVKKPQGFTKVYHHVNWIKRAMLDNYTIPNGCNILDLSLVLIVLAQLFVYWI